MKPTRRTVRLDGDGFRILACFGADACPHRALDAPDLPRRIHDALTALHPGEAQRKRGCAPDKAHNIIKVAISYCPNACARSQIADIGLIGASAPVAAPADCIACGACSEVCRENAVRLDEADALTGIDASACLNCGACAAVCPTDALSVGAQGFRLMLGGKLGRRPRFAEELSGLRRPEDIPALAARCVQNFLRLARGRERMGDVVTRVGAAALAQEDTD